MQAREGCVRGCVYFSRLMKLEKQRDYAICEIVLTLTLNAE